NGTSPPPLSYIIRHWGTIPTGPPPLSGGRTMIPMRERPNLSYSNRITNAGATPSTPGSSVLKNRDTNSCFMALIGKKSFLSLPPHSATSTISLMATGLMSDSAHNSLSMIGPTIYPVTMAKRSDMVFRFSFAFVRQFTGTATKWSMQSNESSVDSRLDLRLRRRHGQHSCFPSALRAFCSDSLVASLKNSVRGALVILPLPFTKGEDYGEGYDATLALSLAAQFRDRELRCFLRDFRFHGKAIARQKQKGESAFHHSDLHSGARVCDRVDDRPQTVHAIFANRLARTIPRLCDHRSARTCVSDFRNGSRPHPRQAVEPASARARAS